ncbi:winged helix-turn-helix transcriptional regulator [Actinocrispum wychmicini]|uniref:HxlR family transcriptional regulator n=1 Tax=Actinocrispum wychmicini TaxID=1213861 RepID=A0A4R2JB05_9PSEU|nr:winged helix-turn-helix transcriptional regulator [Actinocrispum wychmicini]TCO55072.1 HxlR family transcriptional regulator [Actinocrispum wychmicini]
MSDRSYDEPCGIARALDMIGQRWALLVVRELLYGPKRFTDLRAGLPTASQNVLSQRLRELEDNGLVVRRRLGPPANAWVYDLTDRGRALEPVLIELGRWGSLTPLVSTAGMSVFAFVLALKTTFRPDLAGEVGGHYELRVEDDRFHAEIADGRVAFTRGAAADPDVVIEGTVAVLRSIVFGGRPVADAIRAGHVRIEGDGEAAARFLAVFPRPS